MASKLGESPTMGAAQSAVDVVNLAMGEPAESPCDQIIDAAIAALRRGDTRYGPPAGLLELRESLAAEHMARTGLQTTIESVIVTAGGKPALFDALLCILEPGDEVLVLAPYWPTFLHQIELCGGVAAVVPCGPSLEIDPERIRASCGKRTRAIIVNSPSNPSSLAIDAETMGALVDLAVENDLWILSDEVYRDLVFDGPVSTPLALRPEAQDRVVVIDSFSKRFAMTGLRLGSAVGPAPLISAMIRVATATTTHPSMPSQHAGIAALALDGNWEQVQHRRYRLRRDATLAALRKLGAVVTRAPDAAFYLFPEVSSWMERIGSPDDVEFCRRLRQQARVALIPGSAFGAPGRVRVSCGAGDDDLAKAMERIGEWLGRPAT